MLVIVAIVTLFATILKNIPTALCDIKYSTILGHYKICLKKMNLHRSGTHLVSDQSPLGFRQR